MEKWSFSVYINPQACLSAYTIRKLKIKILLNIILRLVINSNML